MPGKSKKYPPAYQLPSGEVIKDADRYCREWRAFAKPIEILTGLRLSSYDPGLYFVGNGSDGHSLSLPTWFVEKVNELIVNAKRNDGNDPKV